MKQTYFKHFSFAKKVTNRRFMSVANQFRTTAFKGDGGEGGGDDKRTKEDLLKEIQARIDTGLGTRATKAELEAIQKEMTDQFKDVSLESIRAMADDKTGAMALLAQQGLKIARLEQEGLKSRSNENLSIREQIVSWRDANKAALEKIAAGEKAEVKPLELRVASPMTPATVNGGSSPYIGRTEVEAGVNPFLRLPNVFWEHVIKGRTSSPTYVWVNKTNPLGAAAFIGPGVAKPGISFELAAETSVAKKIADSAKAATELLQDIDGMETFIMTELKDQVFLKINSKLMDNVESGTEPSGIKQKSTTYTLTTVLTSNPNYMDALRALVAQLRSGVLVGDITIFINPIDSANMDIAKALTSGVYLLPPFMTADGKSVSGATIVEDSNVPVGYVQAAFMKYFRVLMYKDYTVTWGWENDDFTKNLVTAVGEVRLHQFVNSIHTGFAIYDTFANILAAITAPPVAP